MGWNKAKSWTQAGDGEVKAHLDREIARVKADLDGFAVLRLAPGATKQEVRNAFLDATKTYHPNRFARRPQEIRDAATQLFVHIKKGYEHAKRESNRDGGRSVPTSCSPAQGVPKVEPVAAPTKQQGATQPVPDTSARVRMMSPASIIREVSGAPRQSREAV